MNEPEELKNDAYDNAKSTKKRPRGAMIKRY